jgi:hypothetical protein
MIGLLALGLLVLSPISSAKEAYFFHEESLILVPLGTVPEGTVPVFRLTILYAYRYNFLPVSLSKNIEQ